MLLTLDIGNTEITAGLFRWEDLGAHWRMTTNPGRTPDEWGSAVSGFILAAGHSPNEVRAVCLASVAPSVTQALVEGIARVTGCTGVQIDARARLPVELDVDEPLSVGADRIVNALAALEIYGGDTIVVDFGTATTFDCVTAEGRFIGGVIMPGLRTAADQLTQRTAKLPATELRAPEHVIGRRTEECIQAGVGGRRPKVVATGGLATVVAPLTTSIEETDPDLTLRGLRLAAGHLGLTW